SAAGPAARGGIGMLRQGSGAARQGFGQEGDGGGSFDWISHRMISSRVSVLPLLAQGMIVSRTLVGLVIDTLEFAREGRSVSGTVPLSALPRLREWVGEGSATLACELQGRREDGRNWLSLGI